jgi:hypothetical protein
MTTGDFLHLKFSNGSWNFIPKSVGLTNYVSFLHNLKGTYCAFLGGLSWHNDEHGFCTYQCSMRVCKLNERGSQFLLKI